MRFDLRAAQLTEVTDHFDMLANMRAVGQLARPSRHADKFRRSLSRR